MTLALLFAGQGSQHPEMLRWVDAEAAAASTMQRLAGALGVDWRSRLADPAWSSANRVAQILLTGMSIAAWACLSDKVPAPAAIAGYSVGELPAFCAAGVFDAATALALAHDRADAMQRSVAGHETAMLAVQGAPPQALAAACRRHALALAIRQAADRVVLGGEGTALADARSELETAGARCTPLAIHVASHTPWVAQAAREFARRLAGIDFAPPRTRLVCNLGAATPRTPGELRRALAGQIASTVPWDLCMDAVAERQPRCVLEVGPGNALSRLWNERADGAQARSVDEFRSAAAVAHWVRSTLG